MTRPAWRDHLYCSAEEAEARTGYFDVQSVKITVELARQIRSYLTRENLVTHQGVNQAHTSDNTYTCKFCLKIYQDYGQGRSGAYAYIDGRGAWGYRKHMDSKKVAERMSDLEAKTPSLKQIYFWICQKYPDQILWLNFSVEKPIPRGIMPG